MKEKLNNCKQFDMKFSVLLNVCHFFFCEVTIGINYYYKILAKYDIGI